MFRLETTLLAHASDVLFCVFRLSVSIFSHKARAVASHVFGDRVVVASGSRDRTIALFSRRMDCPEWTRGDTLSLHSHFVSALVFGALDEHGSCFCL